MHMKFWFRKLLCRVFLFLIVAASALGAQSRATNDSFQRGDGVRVAIWRDPSREGVNIQSLGISASYTIDNRGFIHMPLIGEVYVLGNNAENLATVIKEKYAPFISDMIVICHPLIRVSALGAVRRPGSYFVERRTSLWELIELAGGLDDNANIKKIKIQRSGKTVAKDLMSGYEKATSLDELRVHSGDQVMVPGASRITVKNIIEVTRFALSVATFIIVRSQ